MIGFSMLAAVTIACAFAYGLLGVLANHMKLSIAEHVADGRERFGGFLAALGAALILLFLVGGVLSDVLGVKGVLTGGALLTALGCALLAVSQTHPAAVSAVFLAGAGSAFVSTAGCLLMPKAFFPTHPAAAVNLGFVFYGLGTLLVPALADHLPRRIGFRRSFTLLAGLGLLPAVLGVCTPQETFPLPTEASDVAATFAHPVLWLAALGFLFYAPIEGSLGTWAVAYLKELGYQERRVGLVVAGFWGVLLASRLGIALLLEGDFLPVGTAPWLLVFLGLAAAVALGNIVGALNWHSAGFSMLLVGALLGPIFPTLLGLLFQEFSEAQRGTVVGCAFAMSMVGSLLVPRAVAAYARRTSVRRALTIPVLLALLLSVTALTLALALPQLRRG